MAKSMLHIANCIYLSYSQKSCRIVRIEWQDHEYRLIIQGFYGSRKTFSSQVTKNNFQTSVLANTHSDRRGCFRLTSKIGHNIIHAINYIYLKAVNPTHAWCLNHGLRDAQNLCSLTKVSTVFYAPIEPL